MFRSVFSSTKIALNPSPNPPKTCPKPAQDLPKPAPNLPESAPKPGVYRENYRDSKPFKEMV